MLCVSSYYLVWFVWLMVYQFIMIYLLNAVIKPLKYSLNGTDRSCIYDNITKLSNNICFFNLGNGDFKTYHKPPYSEKRIGVDGNLQWNVARCLLQKEMFFVQLRLILFLPMVFPGIVIIFLELLYNGSVLYPVIYVGVPYRYARGCACVCVRKQVVWGSTHFCGISLFDHQVICN